MQRMEETRLKLKGRDVGWFLHVRLLSVMLEGRRQMLLCGHGFNQYREIVPDEGGSLLTNSLPNETFLYWWPPHYAYGPCLIKIRNRPILSSPQVARATKENYGHGSSNEPLTPRGISFRPKE